MSKKGPRAEGKEKNGERLPQAGGQRHHRPAPAPSRTAGRGPQRTAQAQAAQQHTRPLRALRTHAQSRGVAAAQRLPLRGRGGGAVSLRARGGSAGASPRRRPPPPRARRPRGIIIATITSIAAPFPACPPRPSRAGDPTALPALGRARPPSLRGAAGLPCCAGLARGDRGSGFSRFRLGRSRRHTMKSAPPIINSHHDRDVSADSGQWEREISAGRDSARPRPSPGGARCERCRPRGRDGERPAASGSRQHRAPPRRPRRRSAPRPPRSRHLP